MNWPAAATTLTCREIGDVTVVDITGKITLGGGSATVKDGITKLLAEGKKKIVLNLAHTTRLDNSGIAELISGRTTVSREGGHFKLIINKWIRELLQTTKLYTVFETFEDEVEAVASFD